MRLKVTINRQWFRDVPGPTHARVPDHRAGRHEHVEPVAVPRHRSSPTRSTTSTSASLDWVMSPSCSPTSRSASTTTARTAAAPATQLRHSFGASNLQSASFNFPEIPDSLRFVNGYADLPSSSVTKFDDFKRHSVNADLSYYANKWGQHSIKAGVQYERIGNSSGSAARSTRRSTCSGAPAATRSTAGPTCAAPTATTP